MIGIKNNNERAFSPTEYYLCRILNDYKIDYKLDMSWPLKIIVNKKNFDKIKSLCETGQLSSYFDNDINFSVEGDNLIFINIGYEKIIFKAKKDIISSVKEILLSIIGK